MNSGDGLSKDRHDHGVGSISARELHVIGELVRWNTLQNELTSISVFAFVALEWNSKKSNPDGNNDAKDNRGQNPPPNTQSLSAIVNPMSHKSCYSVEKRKVQLGHLKLGRLRRLLRPLHLHEDSAWKASVCVNSRESHVVYARNCRASFFFTTWRNRLRSCLGGPHDSGLSPCMERWVPLG